VTTATLAAPARLQLDVKKSRFLANAAPVADPASALAFLAEVAVPDATHNCWAYRIGAQYRFNDDGEPGGTAGRPILAAIDGQRIDRVIVVVTRWFGGIKLGAGGLVRAYGGAAAECLRLAERIAIVTRVSASVTCAFTAMGAVHQVLSQFEHDKLAEDFTDAGVRLRFAVPAPTLPRLAQALRDATRGQAVVAIDDDATAA
jgi:uncharacterized YigZ family protein